MYLIQAKYLIPKAYRAMTIFPFILIRYQEDKKNEVLINHEKIHLRQQLEFLILPFFIWYCVEFLFRCMQYQNFNLGYQNISFEREAYQHENQLDYLKKRKLFQSLNYLKITQI